MDQIEQNVSCLKAMNKEAELEACNSAVMLEDKLNPRLKQEFTKFLATNETSLETRMKMLLKFLGIEKKAAHIRVSNYTNPIKTKDDADDDQTSSNATAFNNPRGGGKNGNCGGCGRAGKGGDRGRGRSYQGNSNRNFGRGGNSGQGRGKPRKEMKLVMIV